MDGVKPLCANCRFWAWDRMGPDYREFGNNDLPIPSMFDCMHGRCMRHAPIIADVKTSGLGSSTDGNWPRTAGHQWCGDWELVRQVLDTTRAAV